MDTFKFRCPKCNCITSVKDDILLPYSGKLVIINCANPSCGCKSKIQVPAYRSNLQSSNNIVNEIAPTEIPFAQNRSVHFVKLKVLSNVKTEEQVFLLKMREQTVGRLSQIPGDYRPNIQLVTSDRKISKNHFQIIQFKNQSGDTEVVLKDEQSTNGTFINESKIPLSHFEEIYLTNGDRIRVGDTIIEIEMF